MEKVNFDGKRFGLLSNSKDGEVSTETTFEYKQNDGLVTAEYSGGKILHGRIIARQIANGNLKMVYNCLTADGELKSGKADAEVSIDNTGKVRLDLQWQWLDGDGETGRSTYLEID